MRRVESTVLCGDLENRQPVSHDEELEVSLKADVSGLAVDLAPSIKRKHRDRFARLR